MTRTQIFVGIDVSKAQVDVALRPEGRFAASNDEPGVHKSSNAWGGDPDAGGVGSHRRVGAPAHGRVGRRGGAGRRGQPATGTRLCQGHRATR